MFKEKLSLSRRFTKRRAKPNSFWSNFCWHRSSQTSSWNPVPCARSRRPFRLAGTGDRLWEAGHWAGEGSQAPTVVAAGLQAPERHSHPCRCSALWSGLSWETKRPQRIGSALVVAQAGLSTPFNSPPAPYLRVASRGVPPPPAQPQRKQSLGLLKSREFQSQRSRRVLGCHPVGRGQQASVAGRGPPSRGR